MRKLFVVLIAACALTALPLHAQAFSFTQNTFLPFDVIFTNPCNGDVVELSGTLHDLFHITFDDAGGVHVKIHDEPQGISGVSLITGDKYQATGVTQQEFNLLHPLPVTQSFVNNFKIIGQGPNNNFLVHENAHFTIDANGDLTSAVDNFSVECR